MPRLYSRRSIAPKIDTDARGRRFALSLEVTRRRQRRTAALRAAKWRFTAAAGGPTCLWSGTPPQPEMITPGFTPRRVALGVAFAK